MKAITIAALLAGTALAVPAHAQAPAAPTPPAQAQPAPAGGIQAVVTEIEPLIQEANLALDSQDNPGALQALQDANDRVAEALTQAQGADQQTLTQMEEQLLAAIQALEADNAEEARTVLVEVEGQITEFTQTQTAQLTGQSAEGEAGFEADVEAEVEIDVPEPDVTVVQPDPTVVVDQPQPEVTVDPGRPQVTVNQAAPQVRVAMPQPTITIDMPRPEIIVEMPNPNVSVALPDPRVTVNQPDPTVSVEQGEPQVQVGAQELGLAETPEQEQAEVTVQEGGQANVQVQEAQAAQVIIGEAQPQVTYNAAEPQVQIESAGEPQIQFNQPGEAVVQFRQLSQEETMQLAQGQQPPPPQPAAGATPPPPAPATDPVTTAATDPNAQMDNATMAVNPESAGQVELTVADITGYDIVGANGETLGDVESVVNVNERLYAVIGSGGFLGLGEEQVAIPLSTLVVSDGNLMAQGVTEGQIEALEDFDPNAYPALGEEYAITVGEM